MGWFSDDSDQANSYNEYNSAPVEEHDPSLIHELIAGAASYEAAKAYENHVAENGNYPHPFDRFAVVNNVVLTPDVKQLGPPDSHAQAKEIMAGFAGAFIDREVETKGLDLIDRERAKYEAQQHIDSVNDGEY
ncbi:hypothetical protein N7541_005370 [Penicillium brevicompactum]|uniref:Uncharacterized protein n=1 Tax=Penicillium brevicompactum TaxID=5074 RepID=A0A9W9UUU3_PENBR|nr:uncharacterized protein N7506_005230 [Penicillium brevicompactum]KAJ5337208.1 hypothetical protein N7506_005230 [Penicillium brevicompactum]KAJ5358212.1 hypothetical protein N7541_005370 [Penicillium brevicompactum]